MPLITKTTNQKIREDLLSFHWSSWYISLSIGSHYFLQPIGRNLCHMALLWVFSPNTLITIKGGSRRAEQSCKVDVRLCPEIHTTDTRIF